MTNRLVVLAAVCVLVTAGLPTRAQTPEARYLTPPAEISRALQAAQLPQAILSPTRNVAALSRQHRRQLDRAIANDGDGVSRLDLPVHDAFEAGRQNVAQHHEGFFICVRRDRVETLSAYGMRTWPA
jgi:hypothetical protein